MKNKENYQDLFGSYKNLKNGHIYSVIGTFTHSETNEKLVAYHDSDNNKWVRPLDLFLKKFEKWEDKSRLKYKFKALNSIIEMKNNIRRMRIWLRDTDWCSD